MDDKKVEDIKILLKNLVEIFKDDKTYDYRIDMPGGKKALLIERSAATIKIMEFCAKVLTVVKGE
jgi:hypothetical protein